MKVSIVRSLRDREVACSKSDRQGSNFESCVWRTVSYYSSHHPQEVLLAQFSPYVHKGGLKSDSFHFMKITMSSKSSISDIVNISSVNKSTTSSMVYGELGRYLSNIECTSRCISFWARNISGPVSKLSVKMYNLFYKMYNLGIYNSPWLSFVKSTLLSAGYVWRDQKIPRTLEYFRKVF